MTVSKQTLRFLVKTSRLLILSWTMVPTTVSAQSDVTYSEFLPFVNSVKFLTKATEEQLKDAAKFSSEYTYITDEKKIVYELALDNEHRVLGQVQFADSLRLTNATWYFFDDLHVQGQFVDDRPIGEWRVYDLDNKVSKIVRFREDQRSPLLLENYRVQWYTDEGDTLVDQGIGVYTTYWPQGSIHSTGMVQNGVKEGDWVAYTVNGNLLYEESYQHGHLLRGTSFGADGASYSYDSLYTTIQPYGGWQKYYIGVADRMRYPKQARRAGIEGVVYVQLIVERDGSLKEIDVLQGIGMGCDEQAVKAVQEGPHWHPATVRGQPVRLLSLLPITFRLGDGLSSSSSRDMPENSPWNREVPLKSLPPSRRQTPEKP